MSLYDSMARVELTIEAQVGSDRIVIKDMVLAPVYDDPDARKAIEAQLRYKLMQSILDKWKPKIQVRR
jgi:hypothetical protein